MVGSFLGIDVVCVGEFDLVMGDFVFDVFLVVYIGYVCFWFF